MPGRCRPDEKSEDACTFAGLPRFLYKAKVTRNYDKSVRTQYYYDRKKGK